MASPAVIGSELIVRTSKSLIIQQHHRIAGRDLQEILLGGVEIRQLHSGATELRGELLGALRAAGGHLSKRASEGGQPVGDTRSHPAGTDQAEALWDH